MTARDIWRAALPLVAQTIYVAAAIWILWKLRS
jgi:hypothetical protein